MRVVSAFFTVVLLSQLAVSAQDAGRLGQYADRWFYVGQQIRTEEDLQTVQETVATAAEHGLNGMLWSGALESVGRWPADRLALLAKLKTFCAERKVTIIPILWSIGYGTQQWRHPHLAAGLPCTDVPFAVAGNAATLVPDASLALENGGFEVFKGDKMQGYTFHDKPGTVSFADTVVRHGGLASLRMEAVGANEHGHARVMQKVAVRPHRHYRFTCWVRTAELESVSAFKIQIYGPKGALVPVTTPIRSTMEWQKLTVHFNSGSHSEVRIYVGLWKGRSGTLWLDDFSVKECGPVNVLRRPGTPISVRNDDGTITYEEGRDFLPIKDDRFNSRRPREDDVPITLAPGSRIQDGQRLRVSWYHPLFVMRSQVSTCMSEPALYDYFRESAAALATHLGSGKWFLSMDEIRAGGSCAACKARGLTMAQILGECVSQQRAIIRGVDPDADIYIWSDMFDPNHNAHGDYYLVDGDFTDAWKALPKDIVVSCWRHSTRDKSMRFFAENGFKTQAAAYYDTDTLDTCRDWLKTANETPNCTGIMYTTWRKKYGLLADFGDLIRAQSRPLTEGGQR
ncbi:MAG: hypothetical protein HN742_41565 [Lentisphaerae bacterium]|jgi:hypothetical protein|nr:hypothetical protein [Lentisphaerota bacterium]MBT4816965.1 hypothetical protein [Lentisphaerota bacterium]MBT5611737.1 hypothetical protein [Lentisphaerota bacterium]MBT7054139.1 hypothetical protein [Lentisphaerota bacterium]MBT7848426.1 hypothetical protein [Lentisphaerota bacterium]